MNSTKGVSNGCTFCANKNCRSIGSRTMFPKCEGRDFINSSIIGDNIITLISDAHDLGIISIHMSHPSESSVATEQKPITDEEIVLSLLEQVGKYRGDSHLCNTCDRNNGCINHHTGGEITKCIGYKVKTDEISRLRKANEIMMEALTKITNMDSYINPYSIEAKKAIQAVMEIKK